MIVDRIRQKAFRWSTKFLTTAGKMIMLKSILAAMPTYTMSCFKLPCSLYKRIQSALTRFWWDFSMDKKKMCWISWENLTRAKGEGGLGFTDLQTFNDALLAKLSWRLLSKPTCLLARILLGKYCHSSSFLDCKPPASTSHGWRGICIGKDLLKQHLGKVIGDGKQISLWNVPWMSLQSSTIAMGPPPEASHSWTASQLISTDTLEWDREKIKQTLPEFESEILEIRLSKLGAKDTFVWLPAKNGSYSASSGYYASIVKEPAPSFFAAPTADFNWTKEIWKVNSSQKTKIFMWKAMRGALPTGENLRRRGINAEARCPFCGEEESTFHLFFTCSFAAEVWQSAPLKQTINSSLFSTFQDLIEKAKLFICLPPTAIGAGTILPWLLWSIWISRNQRIFKDRHSSPIETLNRALSTSREWLLAQEALRTTPRQVNFVHHRSALPTTVTCHTDAAWNRDNKMAGIGWIFNSDKKEIAKIGFGSSRHVRSPLLGEALAIHEALSHASSLGFSNLIEDINSEDPPMELHGSPQYPATIL